MHDVSPSNPSARTHQQHTIRALKRMANDSTQNQDSPSACSIYPASINSIVKTWSAGSHERRPHETDSRAENVGRARCRTQVIGSLPNSSLTNAHSLKMLVKEPIRSS